MQIQAFCLVVGPPLHSTSESNVGVEDQHSAMYLPVYLLLRYQCPKINALLVLTS